MHDRLNVAAVYYSWCLATQLASGFALCSNPMAALILKTGLKLKPELKAKPGLIVKTKQTRRCWHRQKGLPKKVKYTWVR